MADRDDDSPATWGELREAMKLLIDFSLKADHWVTQAHVAAARGDDPAATPQDELMALAKVIEAKFNLDGLARND